MLQPANGSEYAVLVDLVKCGLSDQVTCLRAVTLALYDGSVVSSKYTHTQIILYIIQSITYRLIDPGQMLYTVALIPACLESGIRVL